MQACNFLPPVFADRDEQADRAQVPKLLAEFTGQRRVTDNLSLAIAAAQGVKRLWIMFCWLVHLVWARRPWRHYCGRTRRDVG